MKNKNTTMYVLMGDIEYEGSAPLGVYSSREKAQKALDEYCGGYYGYRIKEVVVDSAADAEAF
jgi:hypothetical protein